MDKVKEQGTRHRYEEVAAFVVRLIETGTLPPGTKVPSLRTLGRQLRVSLSTTTQAYRLLEDKGLLEARPQSGFYVASSGPVALELPEKSRPPMRPHRVSVAAPVLQLLEQAADPTLQPLGCAIPSPEMLAAGKLDRFLARAARTKGAEFNTYGTPSGEPYLRRELARRAIRWGQNLSPDEIAVTCGCTEALSIALKATTLPGDVVAIESPTYFGVLQVIESLNLHALELPTDATSGVDIASLERALGRNAIQVCLFSSSFSNPLGSTLPSEKKRRLLDLLKRHEIPLIEDDIYGDIHFTEERPRPFMALDPSADVLYCSSFSKTLAPGYRVGWIATRRRLRQVLEGKFSTSLCSPILPQIAIADFLSSGGYDAHLRRLRRAFRSNIERMLRVIDEAFPKGTRVTRPAGGFVLWVKLPGAVPSDGLLEQALAEKICFAPGKLFSTTGQYDDCLRLSCGHAWSDPLEEAVRRIGALAQEWKD